MGPVQKPHCWFSHEAAQLLLMATVHLTRKAFCLYYNVINQVISYWTSYRSEVSCIGPRPLTDKSPYRSISSASTSSIPSPCLAPMSDILFKCADMIFVCLFTILLDRLNRRHCFCLNSVNAARDLAREF